MTIIAFDRSALPLKIDSGEDRKPREELDLKTKCRQERVMAFERLRQILGAKKSNLEEILRKRLDIHSRPSHPHIDHFKCFAKNGQEFIFDNPYGVDNPQDSAPYLKQGWRILYLPPQMSTYLVGITYPRLLAPPHSRIDLLYLLRLLELAQFKGNEVRSTHHRMGGWWHFNDIAKQAKLSKQLNMLEHENNQMKSYATK